MGSAECIEYRSLEDREDSVAAKGDRFKERNMLSHKREYFEKVKRLKEKKYFGNKTIGHKSSYIYLINQIFGSGIVSIPYVFKRSGWFPCLVTNICICILTIFNTLLFLRSMTMIPNNIHFNKRYEYISTVCYFLGKNNIFFWFMQICYYVSILASNIISIVIVSHALDHILINLFGYTVGFIFYPKLKLYFFNNINELYYSENYIVCVTVGYVINAIVSIYFSQTNLEDNMKIQLLSFLFLMSTVFQMIFLSSLKIYRKNANEIISNKGIKKYTDIEYPTAFGDFNFKQLLSSYISSYSAVTVIPCWANEMKADVKIVKTVWISNFFCCFVYYIFGYILCTAYPNISNDNILYDILQNPSISNYMKMSIYLFDLLTIAPGIYVYCIATRYNLINSNLCSEKVASLFGTFFPFFISWFFTSRAIFENIFTWSSLVFSYACNFITPSVIYLIACKNIPYSDKNPLHYIHVLYDPKEYKKKKPLYTIFYPNVINKEEDNLLCNTFSVKEEKLDGEKKGVEKKTYKEILPLSKEHKEGKLPLLSEKSRNKMYLPPFDQNNACALEWGEIAQTTENKIPNGGNSERGICYKGEKDKNEEKHHDWSIGDEEKRINTMCKSVQAEIENKGNKTPHHANCSNQLLNKTKVKTNLENTYHEHCIVPIKTEVVKSLCANGDHINANKTKKENNFVSLNMENGIVETNTGFTETEVIHKKRDTGRESERENTNANANANEENVVSKVVESERGQNSCAYIHDSFEDKYGHCRKSDTEKNIRRSGDNHHRKNKADAFEFRKYNSLFNMKGNNINKNNSNVKSKLPSNIRKSIKHKTVMGFEEKNKKRSKKVSIQKEREFSPCSDISDSNILNYEIIADLSKDIYNDINIIKKNYERDEYLIKYADIFDSFLNLKLILESNSNECNDLYKFNHLDNVNHVTNLNKEKRNDLVYNDFHFSKISNRNTVNGTITEMSNTLGGNTDEGYAPSQEKGDQYCLNIYDKGVDEHEEGIFLQKGMKKKEDCNLLKREHHIEMENAQAEIVHCGITQSEEKKVPFVNTQITNMICSSDIPSGREKTENKLVGTIFSPPDNSYKKKIENIKKEFHLFINGINNKKNFTWAFDGNKNRDISSVVVNKQNINVSNVNSYFNTIDSIGSTFIKLEGENNFLHTTLNLNKGGQQSREQTDEWKKILPLNKANSYSTSPSITNYRMEDDTFYRFMKVRTTHCSENSRSLSLEIPNELSERFHADGVSTKKNEIENASAHSQKLIKYGTVEMSTDIDKKCVNVTGVGFPERGKKNSLNEVILERGDDNGDDGIRDETHSFNCQKEPGKFKGEHTSGIDKGDFHSRDKIMHFLNSYSRKSKIYKDVNTLTVPDNVYNVIPKINKVNEKNSFDDTINNIFNYYKYNFLLSFSEQNREKRNLKKKKKKTNIYFLENYINRKGSKIRGLSGTNNDKEDITNGVYAHINYSRENITDGNITKKEFFHMDRRYHYLSEFSNDEKKEPLLKSNKRKKQNVELPQINLICPEKPLHGYEDAYQIDDYVNGNINENIIHVYPSRYLRIKHVKTTELLLCMAVLLLLLSVLYDSIY
ncbi:amino acid transporter, putative [Plasmodium ovale curtisi]|uniref:Amino acid transporter, putative n=1 Tax=Plasmodium ovale curtisi TaxID=864141 RepID=A0A1A8WYB9_PLAOA|nr:amino acid transporter, putative [Plasmodium ovale curtisi]SBS97359.1 amino acid transporter, putative [Plasmodium ovale curtisi]